jgi:hypothetical protein
MFISNYESKARLLKAAVVVVVVMMMKTMMTYTKKNK